MKKMICRILLLFTLNLCVSGRCVYHKTYLHYQAEENSNVTVEWQFSSRTDISVPSLKIHCVLTPDLKVFFHLDNTFEEPQHEQFAGRVQCDTAALCAGLVRLHVFSVRTDDSGLYHCRMATAFGKKVKEFSLNITAASDEPKPRTTKPKPASQERVYLFAGLGLVAVAAAAVLVTRKCVSIYSALKTT